VIDYVQLFGSHSQAAAAGLHHKLSATALSWFAGARVVDSAAEIGKQGSSTLLWSLRYFLASSTGLSIRCLSYVHQAM
jgi:hypothetical protein